MRATIDRAAWIHRDKEFGLLATRAMPDTSTDEVVMQFGPKYHLRASASWQVLVALWRELPRNPTLLAIRDIDESGDVWLDYAAIDWKTLTSHVQVDMLARWVVQLSRAFEPIARLPHESWKYFTNPSVYIDLGGHIRLAFLPAQPEDQKWLSTQPRNERAWVTCIAKVIDVVSGSDDGAVFYQLSGYKTLRQLREAFQKKYPADTERIGSVWSAWKQLERGLGWLEMNNLDEAVPRLSASNAELTSTIAIAALERCKERLRPSPDESDGVETPIWIARAGWSRRSASFGELAAVSSPAVPATKLLGDESESEWSTLRSAWERVPHHANLLRPVRMNVLTPYVTFAAIDWDWKPSRDASRVAGWAVQLASAFECITSLPRHEWSLFSRPLVKLDIGGHVRIAFLPAPSQPPATDEQMLVLAVGRVLESLCPEPDDPAIALRIAKCVNPDRRERYETLAQVRAAFSSTVTPLQLVRTNDRRVGWEHAERGLGFVFLERYEDALKSFVAANHLKSIPLTKWGISYCRTKLKLLGSQSKFAGLPGDLFWNDVKDEITALEKDRAFREALGLYARLCVTEDTAVEIFTRRARCHLEHHDTGEAVDYARRALELEPSSVETRLVLIARCSSGSRTPTRSRKPTL